MTDFRALARDLIVYACNGPAPHGKGVEGRRAPDPGFPGDPVYNAVTEGRHASEIARLVRWLKKPVGPRPFYSSCGDLAHWLFFRLGARQKWINRHELDGWHYGENTPADNNVTTLSAKSVNGVRRAVTVDTIFQCGDVVVVNEHDPGTTHVRVVLAHWPEEGKLLTGDFGQPGGAIRESAVTIEGKRMKLGSRYADSHVVLSDVLDQAASRGQLVTPESAEAWGRRLNLPPYRDEKPERDTEPAPPPKSTPLGTPAQHAVLRLGSVGPDVRLARTLLGLCPGDQFDAAMKKAVEDFQLAHGLKKDGVIGNEQTWPALLAKAGK